MAIKPAAQAISVRMVTLDGMYRGRLDVPRINIWRQPEDRLKSKRPVVERMRHGQQVTLLEQQGEMCRIRTTRGNEGWVRFWFIKELKGNL